MKLLIDNNLPPRWAVALRALFEDDGDVIVHLRERFDAATTDAEWIRALGGEGNWSVLSSDIRIAKQRPSRELFIGAGLVGFFFRPTKDRIPNHIRFARLLVLWTSIKDQVRLNANGCFELPPKGSKFTQIGR